MGTATVTERGTRRRNGSHSAVERVREDVPALRRRMNGHPLVYLDGAATTQRLESVLEAVDSYYRNDNGNTHQESHELGKRSKQATEEARQTIARFIGAESKDEVVWTTGTTEGINIVARTWTEEHVKRGDNIVLTTTEHFSNLIPWQQLAKRTGVELRFADVDAEGRLRLDEVERLVTKRTKLVAVSHVSNVLGMINPVEQIAEIAHARGARFLVDGAQSAPHLRIDVKAIDCDFFAFSGHKLGALFGTGALWARADLLEAMTPHAFGGGAAKSATLRRHSFKSPPDNFEAGTGNPAGALGLGVAVEEVEKIGQDELWAYEQRLTEHGLGVLGEIEELRILGGREAWERVPLFTFTYKDLDGKALASRLAERGIAVSGGNLNAQPALTRFGLETATRASCWVYNTTRELDRLAEALRSIRRS
jgi:cysteine desulfurase / selenocysteine lyase